MNQTDLQGQKKNLVRYGSLHLDPSQKKILNPYSQKLLLCYGVCHSAYCHMNVHVEWYKRILRPLQFKTSLSCIVAIKPFPALSCPLTTLSSLLMCF